MRQQERVSKLSDVFAPAVQISELFAYQSYFDTSLLEKAILTQPSSQPIVPSTALESQISGVAVGLHPSSQTPVAIQFNVAGSPTYILKPGQVVRPLGERAAGAFKFGGFTWGLPFGWLGGGMATIVVFQTYDARVAWSESTEVIFHRSRFAVKQPSDLTSGGSFNNAPKNWPMRFPWTQALRGSGSFAQKGKAQIGVIPTRTIMQLRTGLAAAGVFAATKMRAVFQGTNDLGLDSAGALISDFPAFVDVTWPGYTNLGTSGNLARAIPALEFATGPLVRLAADDGGVIFVDASGAATLNGLFVDVVRYGRL